MVFPQPPKLDSKVSFTVLAMKNLINLVRTEFRRLTTVYYVKMSHASKK